MIHQVPGSMKMLTLKRKMKCRFLFFLLSIVSVANGQTTDSTKNNSIKKDLLIFGGIYSASMIGLNEIWYKSHPRSEFHFFDDSKEWMQMDKVGHIYTSWHLTRVGYNYFQSKNLPKNKSLLFGAITSTIMMAPIEWLDGYSTAYGASTSDIIANLSGTLLFAIHKSLNDHNLIKLKYSYWPSQFADERPEVLGENTLTRLIKDYNAQHYWISVDLSKVHNSIPKWINLAFGYSANGMVHARSEVNSNSGYFSYREYFLALDLDLSNLKYRNQFQKILINTLDMVHIPFPALRFTSSGTNIVIR